MPEDPKRNTSHRWWYLILVIPFIATLFPQLYDSLTPSLGGIPFFYWYQLLWVIITGILTLIVYAATREH
jgi:hypothetical protein